MAYRRIFETLKWRSEVRPFNLRLNDVRAEVYSTWKFNLNSTWKALQGKLYMSGIDKQGRQIVYYVIFKLNSSWIFKLRIQVESWNIRNPKEKMIIARTKINWTWFCTSKVASTFNLKIISTWKYFQVEIQPEEKFKLKICRARNSIFWKTHRRQKHILHDLDYRPGNFQVEFKLRFSRWNFKLNLLEKEGKNSSVSMKKVKDLRPILEILTMHYAGE